MAANVDIAVDQRVELGQGLERAVLAIEGGRQIGAGRGEAGREIQRPPQQFLGIGIAADAPGQLGHHADRRHIGRPIVEVAAKDGLGRGKIVVEQGFGSAQQRRIARRSGDGGVQRRRAAP